MTIACCRSSVLSALSSSGGIAAFLYPHARLYQVSSNGASAEYEFHVYCLVSLPNLRRYTPTSKVGVCPAGGFQRPASAAFSTTLGTTLTPICADRKSVV